MLGQTPEEDLVLFWGEYSLLLVNAFIPSCVHLLPTLPWCLHVQADRPDIDIVAFQAPGKCCPKYEYYQCQWCTPVLVLVGVAASAPTKNCNATQSKLGICHFRVCYVPRDIIHSTWTVLFSVMMCYLFFSFPLCFFDVLAVKQWMGNISPEKKGATNEG